MAILARIPVDHRGEPAGLTGSVIFLAYEAAACIHGATIPVAGAWLTR